MSVNRRQFALWSTAALVVGTSASAAQPKAAPTTPLRGLIFSHKVEREGDLLTVEVSAMNPTAAGVTFRINMGRCTIDGKEPPFATCYLKDQHPMSRRMSLPDYIDLGPNRTLVVASVRYSLLNEDAGKDPFPPGTKSDLTLGFLVDGAPVEQIVLQQIELHPVAKKRS